MRFLDPEQEGREEWVPPARLKVPWEQPEQFMARDRRWEQVRELSCPTHGETDEHAAGVVFDVVYRGQVMEVSHRTRDAGLGTISDLPRVLGDIGWERERVAVEPGVFFDDPDRAVGRSLARHAGDRPGPRRSPRRGAAAVGCR